MKQTIIIIITYVIIMLPFFYAYSCFDIPLNPFIQSFEFGFTVTYSFDNSEVKARPLDINVTLVYNILL